MPNLTTRLRALGLTQRRFATLTGASVAQINRWATGRAETPRWVWCLLDAWDALATL